MLKKISLRDTKILFCGRLLKFYSKGYKFLLHNIIQHLMNWYETTSETQVECFRVLTSEDVDDFMIDPQTVLNTLRMIKTSVQVVLFFLECLAFFGKFPKGFKKFVWPLDKFWKSLENGQKFSEYRHKRVYQYFKRHGWLSIWNISCFVQLYISVARYPYLHMPIYF